MPVRRCGGTREPGAARLWDCKGEDDEYNCWTTWGAPKVPSKYSVVRKGPLRAVVLRWLNGAHRVIDLLWLVLGETMRVDIVEKVSRKQALSNPAVMSSDKTPV